MLDLQFLKTRYCSYAWMVLRCRPFYFRFAVTIYVWCENYVAL